ncbi:MAG: SIS domain-containing protein [Acidimicrobiia bacterium]
MTTTGTALRPLNTGRRHLDALVRALGGLDAELPRLRGWAGVLAGVLSGGGRLLAAGNGGSAAQAQHLTAELVGRYRDDRPPFSALALHAETSCLTAITNDYGAEEAFARQVRAHGRPGDVLVALSTSGGSPNVVAAAEAGAACGLRVWSLTGRRPNALAARSHDALCVDAADTATVQEAHLVAVHLLCAFLDVAVGASEGAP